MDGWFAEEEEEGGGCTILESGEGRRGVGGVGVGEDGSSVMQTAVAGVATGRHNHKTDASRNPI